MDPDKKFRNLSFLIVLLFVLSLVPIVVLMFYAHPFADEYTEPVGVYLALKSGKGIAGMTAAAWQSMIQNYLTWQGTYSAKFVMAMNPSVFGDRYYFLGILTVFSAALLEHFFFLYVLLCRILKFRKSEWMIVSCVTFLIGVHFMPDPTQGIFWFESSSYYLGFYGLGLLSLGLCLLAAVSTTPGRSYAYMILSCLTAFLTAGGNMQSGMLFAFALLGIVIVSFYVRNPNRIRTIPPLAVFLAGFLISVIAPGNAVRGKGSYSGIGPVMTVYKSLHQACVLLDGWRNLFMISLLIGLVLPVCLRAVKRIDFKFPYPLLITIYLFGMFSCQFAPSFYAYDMIGPLRSVNPIYISFVLLTVFLVYYWCGWLYEKVKDSRMYQSFDHEHFYAWYFPKGILLTALLFGIGCISSDRLSYITGVSALTSLVSGEAQTYDAERFERERIFLENVGSKTDIVIDDLSAKPYLLYFADGEPKEDSTNWINRGISTYYGLGSLTKKENGFD